MIKPEYPEAWPQITAGLFLRFIRPDQADYDLP